MAWLGRNFLWSHYNQDQRIDTDMEDLEAHYYTYDAANQEARLDNMWTGMLLGASHLTIGAAAIATAMLSF